jgi:hypothetical protein
LHKDLPDDPNHELYKDYQSFDKGIPIVRQEALVRYLQETGLLREGQRVLDFGCNQGAFLARLPKGSHAGFEVSAKHRPLVESKGFHFYEPGRPPPECGFDLVTLVHVVEHLQLPGDLLPAVASMKADGHGFLTVPDVADHPTDVYVADHRHHFTVATLRSALLGVGCAMVAPPSTILRGEISLAFRRQNLDHSVATEQGLGLGDAIARTLSSAEDKLMKARRSGRPIGVVGAGMLGALVARFLKETVQVFVDDNPSLQGSLQDGVRVTDMGGWDQVNRTGRGLLVLAVPPSAQAKVAERLRGQGREVVEPFSSLR